MHLLDATSSEDEFEQLLENLPKSPTLIVDFPGNKTSKILEFAAHFQMLKSFRASGIRPTLLIFTADDSTAKDSALETLEFFGDGADYLLIENSARFKSDSFKATPLYDEFVARNSPTLVVPRSSAGTLNAWEAAQHRLGEYLSLDKICKADGLNVTSVLELSGVRDRFLVGCEDCASHIIPDLALIKNKVQFNDLNGLPVHDSTAAPCAPRMWCRHRATLCRFPVASQMDADCARGSIRRAAPDCCAGAGHQAR